jgi:ABC-2 type transport system permease protein
MNASVRANTELDRRAQEPASLRGVLAVYASETFWLFCRAWRKTLRLPLVLVLVLVFPAASLWVLSQLFTSIHQAPTLSASQSRAFFAPGMLVIAALFGSSFTGIGLLGDRDSGFLERLATSPIHHSTILLSKALADSSRTLLQSVILLALLLVLGTPFHMGVIALLGLLAELLVFSLAVAGLSYFLALLTKSSEALMLIEMFLFLLLLFGSNALLPIDTLPGWMKLLALLNPVSYAVTLARQLVAGSASTATYLFTLSAFLGLALLSLSIALKRLRTIL